ncbi:MAG: methionyl-tRNA formyltransferase [Chloroflexota bacterium]
MVRPPITSALRVVFMGSPDFAVPSLRGVAQAGHSVVLVVTQPDRPAGRGKHMRRPAVASTADEMSIPVYQPRTLRTPEARAPIEALQPDIIIVAAFGLLLPRPILDLPRYQCINVHASLLPRHRGAAPIQACIIQGDRETGISIMQMDPGMDTGSIVAQQSLPIGPHDTARALEERLALLGRDLLLETLPSWLSGDAIAVPQDENLATYAPRIQRSDAWIDWNRTADECDRRVRAYQGWPNAYTSWNGRTLLILESRPLDQSIQGTPPGTVLTERGASWSPSVSTGDGQLQLVSVQLEGKRAMSGAELLNGYPAFATARLGEPKLTDS